MDHPWTTPPRLKVKLEKPEPRRTGSNRTRWIGGAQQVGRSSLDFKEKEGAKGAAPKTRDDEKKREKKPPGRGSYAATCTVIVTLVNFRTPDLRLPWIQVGCCVRDRRLAAWPRRLVLCVVVCRLTGLHATGGRAPSKITCKGKFNQVLWHPLLACGFCYRCSLAMGAWHASTAPTHALPSFPLPLSTAGGSLCAPSFVQPGSPSAWGEHVGRLVVTPLPPYISPPRCAKPDCRRRQHHHPHPCPR